MLYECESCGLILEKHATPAEDRAEAERAGSWAAMIATERPTTATARKLWRRQELAETAADWARYGATKAAHYGRRVLAGCSPADDDLSLDSAPLRRIKNALGDRSTDTRGLNRLLEELRARAGLLDVDRMLGELESNPDQRIRGFVWDGGPGKPWPSRFSLEDEP